jgi:hypothetical protein
MKKLLKFLKYTFIIILAILVSTFFYFYFSSKLFLGSKDDEFVRYLDNSKTELKEINEQFFDDNFNRSDVFLFGEIHGFSDNQKVDEELFKFLNKKLGVKYYIAELDSVNTKKLNQFLSKHNKDLDLLKDFVLNVKKRIPQQSSKELFNKWSGLYDYNSTLNDSLKISVLGIDTDFDEKESKISRDSAMIVNFKKIIEAQKLENQKFYGFFGFYHTLQGQPKNSGKPFALRLKNSGYKVSSLVSFTLDSEMYLPKNPQFATPENERIDLVNADGPFMLVKGINDLKEVSKENSITLFKLNNKNSPYLDSQKLISIRSRIFGEDFLPDNDNLRTVDWFQYCILLRNSKPNTPMK